MLGKRFDPRFVCPVMTQENVFLFLGGLTELESRLANHSPIRSESTAICKLRAFLTKRPRVRSDSRRSQSEYLFALGGLHFGGAR